MPPKGRTVAMSLADLGGSMKSTPRLVKPKAEAPMPASPLRENTPLADLVPNPRNPRDTVGDLDDLAGIVDGQLQPAGAISRESWLKLWPEDATEIGDAKWVVFNGCRRLAAAAKFGRDGLDIVVRDDIATSRESVIYAAITENIARRDLDVIEEAKAVESLVQECGTADAAAARLGKSPAWVSQRRSMLKLAPEFQEALRSGELALRKARKLAQVPLEEQVAEWERMLAEPEPVPEPVPEPEPEAEAEEDKEELPPTEKLAAKLRKLKAEPEDLADAIGRMYSSDQIGALIQALGLK